MSATKTHLIAIGKRVYHSITHWFASFSGRNPTELGQLTALTQLSLRDNQLTLLQLVDEFLPMPRVCMYFACVCIVCVIFFVRYRRFRELHEIESPGLLHKVVCG